MQPNPHDGILSDPAAATPTLLLTQTEIPFNMTQSSLIHLQWSSPDPFGPLGLIARMKKLNRKFNEFLNRFITEHWAALAETSWPLITNTVVANKDLLTVMLQLQEINVEDEEGAKLTDIDIKALLMCSYAAESDSNSILAEWALTELFGRLPTCTTRATPVPIGSSIPYTPVPCDQTPEEQASSTPLNDKYNIGVEDVSIAGVKMPNLNSSDKSDPTQRSQTVRRNVAKGSEHNLKRCEEVVRKLDKVPVEVSPFLHLLESTKQEQQCELSKAREIGSLPKKDVIGRGKDNEFVMQWLRKPSNEYPGIDLYRNISLLSIVGQGGMGKTTLLQHVYEHEMTEEFGLKMCVCVSNNFDEKKIIAYMLESLKMTRPPLDALYALQKSLKSEIMSKTFLLVLDGMWDEEVHDKTKWENVLASLSCGSLGSKILVTTRMDFFVPEMLGQSKDSKAEPPYLYWGKPLHVVILKFAFKVFDPGICCLHQLPS